MRHRGSIELLLEAQRRRSLDPSAPTPEALAHRSVETALNRIHVYGRKCVSVTRTTRAIANLSAGEGRGGKRRGGSPPAAMCTRSFHTPDDANI